MEEKLKKITPSELNYLACMQHDLLLELSRVEAFITEIILDARSMRTTDIQVADMLAKAFPIKDEEPSVPNVKKIFILETLARKAREHLHNAFGMMEALPSSFLHADRLANSGEPFEVEDLFTKAEEEGE